ncbi:phosphopentomutase [Salipaludibacillus aurantiacus]|uniref:Phosphopentomutase n=1 Tax=Salipaludibacillus aurantiacus TaxID=1601833 RepID=A0A1H9U9P9_9BACI|nr:phosphopentomutase [Salipaludibacillus aurantiacus]SES05823.1 Phosphopentomutase [Salipaludibacillus aurantiacus]
MGKAILLVLDGLGIGAMNDCKEVKPEDINAHTLNHIRQHYPLDIPVLDKLGLAGLVEGKKEFKEAACGKANLAHAGADTYMGHQEIAGSFPKAPAKRLMRDIHSALGNQIKAAGYKVEYPWNNKPLLLINEALVIGDNLESAVGNIINMTADLNKMPFQDVKKLAETVREFVDTSRVIAFGNARKASLNDILGAVREGKAGQWGVDSPKSGVYGEGYEVFHLGYGVNIYGQFPMIAARVGLPVYRIGKTADVLHGEGPAYPIVKTADVLKKLEEEYMKETGDAAYLVNVQETDLAGHKEDVNWYGEILEEVDSFLEGFIPALENNDILIIMADHGNDPTIGHSNHTREQVPIIVTGKQVIPGYLGERETMADVGATLSRYFSLEPTEKGISFL